MRGNYRSTAMQGVRAREMSTQKQRYANLDSLRQRPQSVRREEGRRSYITEHLDNSAHGVRDSTNLTRQPPSNYEKEYARKLNYQNTPVDHFGTYNKTRVSSQIGRVRDTRSQYWTKSFIPSQPNNQENVEQEEGLRQAAGLTRSTRQSNNNIATSQKYFSKDIPAMDVENTLRRDGFKSSSAVIANIDKVQQKIRSLLGPK